MTQTACPSCGDPIALRQLVCLKCGARLALQPTPWARQPVTVFATVLIAVIVIGAGLFGFAVSELTSDGGGGFGATQAKEKTTPSQTARDAPAVVSGGEQAARSAEEPQPSSGSDPPESSVPDRVPAWPDGLSAHTVVLVTSGDRASAMNAAKEARASGLEAGLLRSDPYDLGTGLWIVFSGQFTTPEGAERQAAQLAGRYPGAYPQLVQRVQ
jgi:hypothetical protein